MTNKQNSIKKEIFLPSIIGDWTTYTAEKNKASISITKSIGTSNKTISESTIEDLLFFHQEFFEHFFNQLVQNIDSHIEVDSVAINVLNHTLFKESLKSDIYISKYSNSELEQVDFILSKKAAKFIAHRLCGGTTLPSSNDPTSIEISLLTVITDQFFNGLSKQWKQIFNYNNIHQESSFGHYTYSPQQSETESIIELTANFKLFNHHDLQCKLLYSLDTIERLLFYLEQLNSNITETTQLTKNTLKKTHVPAKCTIGSTMLTISEMENLEIGDIVLLDNKKINEPFQLSIDNNITFNAQPVTLENNELGVQIINTPYFDTYKKELKKPHMGPFIHETISDVTNPTPTVDSSDDFETETNDQAFGDDMDNLDGPDEEMAMTTIESDSDESSEMMMADESEDTLMDDEDDFGMDDDNIEAVQDEPEEIVEVENTSDSDDFSWDDLDDE
ncbi:MAG: FliM/FliN family flagellar motor switch protein [Candidatus Marinamargulisbacteria bacterium]